MVRTRNPFERETCTTHVARFAFKTRAEHAWSRATNHDGNASCEVVTLRELRSTQLVIPSFHFLKSLQLLVPHCRTGK